jgi:ABC-type transport system substrate-binding protein
MIYDYLFSFDQDGNLIPNIALAASCDAVCMNWTYQIRHGVYWNDPANPSSHVELTAADVAFSFNYNIQNFFQLWAFEPYVNRIVQCSGGQATNCGAVVSSPWNVTVYFDRPFAPGKVMMFPILQQAQWGSISPSQAQGHFDNLDPIGTGPFIADPAIGTQWQTNQPLVVHKNPNYHPVGNHTGPVTVDTVYLQQFADENTLVSAVRAGTIDLAKLTSSGYGSLAGVANVGRQEGLLSTEYWTEIGFQQLSSTSVNGKLNPARWDEKVRRALAMATNKDYIIKTIYQGKGVRGDDLMTPVADFWHYDPTSDGSNLTFSLTAANALLDSAGYTGPRVANSAVPAGIRTAASDINFVNTNGQSVTVPAGTQLIFNMVTRLEFPQEGQTALYLKAEWAQVGVLLNIKNELESALTGDVYSGAVETYIWYWSGDPDPNYLMSCESGYTLDGWNDNYWNNATYNQLYVDSLAAQDPAQRRLIVLQAEKVHYQSAVYIIYIYPFGEWAYRTDHFSGWGDWNAHPYRQIDAFWGANPLFFDLVAGAPPVDNPPTKPVIAGGTTVTAFANTTVSFSGTSSDPDAGQTLSWSWNWGNGEVTINQHDSSITQDSASYMWTLPGTYTVTLAVSDGTLSATSDPVQVTVVQATTPLGWINGTVKDSASSPIVGAAVTTTPGNYAGASDASGVYSVLVPTGTYSAAASKDLYTAQTINNLVVTANNRTWANFTLARNQGWISGTVTSSADGSAIAGAAVYATVSGSALATDLTDAQGHYNLSIVPGTYAMNANATGYHTKNATGVAVTLGATTTQNFVLDPVVVPPTGLSTLVVVAIALVVVAAAAVLVFLMLRRRKKKDDQGRVELPP